MLAMLALVTRPAAALHRPFLVVVPHPAIGFPAIAFPFRQVVAGGPLMLSVSPLPYARCPDVAGALLELLGAPRGRIYVDVHVLRIGGRRESGKRRDQGAGQKCFASDHGRVSFKRGCSYFTHAREVAL